MTAPGPELMEPGTENKSANASKVLTSIKARGDLLCTVFLAVLVLAFFFKTCFAGGSISRLCILAEWDSVFDAWRTGKAQPYDPSLVQIFLPDYVFLAKNLSQGNLPLWNPYCGLGYPFIADIQSSVFAPLRLVFDFFPGIRTYNYYLISEVIVCAVSSFLLARTLGLSRLPAIFAAISYSFCPYNLWYMEMNLGASSCLFPLVSLAFLNAAKVGSLGSAILAGLASAVLILSGHPECSFFGIILSSLFYFIYCLLEPGQKSKRLLSAFLLIAIAAMSTIAFSAPALFPFAEYLINAESYKYGSTYSTPVTINGILFNLFNPATGGASPYLGIIAATLIPAALLGLQEKKLERRPLAATLIMSLICFLLVSQLGPVKDIFSKSPFTAIITRYALPYLLLLFSLLAAFGLSELRKLALPSANQKYQLLKLLLLLLIVPLAAFTASKLLATDQSFLKAADFDAMLPTTAFNTGAWRRDLVCQLLFSITVLLSFFFAKKINKESKGEKDETNQGFSNGFSKSIFNTGTLILIAALLSGFVSQASLAKLSLPQQAKFFYPETELTARLKDPLYRCLSTCEYVLRPATNSVYGINFFTVHNPLFPERFLEFSKACGASTDTFNQKFGTKLSRLLDLASVKYILSFEPVLDAEGASDRFELSYKSKNNICVYENKNALPRAYFVQKSLASKSPEESIELIKNPEFNPRANVVIEDPNAGSSILSTNKDTEAKAETTAGAQAEVKLKEAGNNNKLVLACKNQEAGWLVLTDVFYPGWQAIVDGKESEIKRANFAFRAVKLSPGEHEIIFAYEPLSFTAGCATFFFFLLLTAVFLRSGRWKQKI